MNIEQPIRDMTWGDLRAFVALGASKDDTDDVELAIDDDFDVVGLAIYGAPALAIRVATDGS